MLAEGEETSRKRRAGWGRRGGGVGLGMCEDDVGNAMVVEGRDNGEGFPREEKERVGVHPAEGDCRGEEVLGWELREANHQRVGARGDERGTTPFAGGRDG